MDLFNIMAKITLDSSEYEKGMQEVSNSTSSGGLGGKIKTGLGNIAKVGAVAFGAMGAAAISAATVMAKSALSSYAEYEQLSGGVKKLFGEEASKQVTKYAQNAYKTAGMSANEYMETATSFSASLISSLGGDTKRAAEITDVAMRSMSDNVNTFGGDIESVKYAYQGFAKQNYTMLDNLKLGYGGTKTEMERLIKDANAYRKAQGKNADLTIDSFADIVEAIQTVQEEQGIAGTTANEAMTTIEGSANATKAAWKNVLTAIGGGGSLKKAIKGLTTSIFGEKEGEGLLNQVIPRIQKIFDGIGQFVSQAAPLLLQKVPDLITAVLPPLIKAAGSLIKSLTAALPGLMQGVWNAIKALAPILINTVKSVVTGIPGAISGIITGIGDWISANASTLSEKGASIWSSIISGISSAIGTIGDTLSGVGDAILGWINGDGLQGLKDGGAGLWENIKTGFSEKLSDLGQLVMKIITGIGTWITTNYDAIAQAGMNILSYIVDGIVSAVSSIATGMLSLIAAAGSWVINNKDQILTVGKTIVTHIVNGIIAVVTKIWEGMVEIASNIKQWFTDHQTEIEEFGNNIITYIANGISAWVSHIKDGFVNVVSTVWSWLRSVQESFKNIGKTIISYVKTGITGWIDKLTEWVKDLPTKIKNKVIALWEDFKGIGGKIVDAIIAGFAGFGEKVKQVIKNNVPKTVDVNVAAKASASSPDEHGVIHAKALHKPYLFNKATVFGRYNGVDQIGGEAGPEMLLGVNALKGMMFESVRGGMQSMMSQIYEMLYSMQMGGGNAALEAQILDILERYLPGITDMQVVLDTGVLAGAIAPGVNAELGNEVTGRRRHNA